MTIMPSDTEDKSRQASGAKEEWFDYFVESSSEWLWEMDAELRITYVSPNIRDILGIDPEQHYGKTRQELLNDDYDRDLWDAHLQLLNERKPFRDFTYYRVGEGVRPIWISTSGVPVYDTTGTFMGYRGTGSDITDRRAVESHLVQADKLATLGTLSAGMAHELSQPLNIIRLKVDSIIYDLEANKGVGQDYVQDLDEINSQVMRMADIIDHMRVFSRKDVASAKPFLPSVSLAAVVRLVEAQFTACDIEIELNLPSANQCISGSTSQLEQVILNLLTNARDAIIARAESEKHGAFSGKIKIEMTEDDAEEVIVITVSDNGGGIEENILANIFDPFFTTKDVGKGTGLGLSISYSIIESMGGKIVAHNLAEGVAFQISLPITK